LQDFRPFNRSFHIRVFAKRIPKIRYCQMLPDAPILWCQQCHDDLIEFHALPETRKITDRNFDVGDEKAVANALHDF